MGVSEKLSACPMVNKPRVIEIKEVRQETPSVKTFIFKDEFCAKAKPGQFIMVWIPGLDEIPLSLSIIDHGGYSGVTVAEVGEATKALHGRRVGDHLGIRGPYGNCFKLVKGSALLIGGGTGLAPLAPLAESLGALQGDVTVVVGAKTKQDIFFLDRFQSISTKYEVITTTDDGSFGVKGSIVTPLNDLLKRKKFEMIYTCGPEPMMWNTFQIAESRSIPIQASLERYIRCAVGICGACSIGKYRVCNDGPVFTSGQLREVRDEFGHFKRDECGRKVSV